MSKEMTKKEKRFLCGLVLGTLVCVILFLFLSADTLPVSADASQTDASLGQIANTIEPKTTPDPVQVKTSADGLLEVDYIDVGQGDCIYIQAKNFNMFIDSGYAENANSVISYLQKKGVTKISAVVITHPHEDHYGAMAAILSKFQVEAIQMPRIPDEFAPTLQAYEKLLQTVQDKGLTIKDPKQGEVLYDQDDLKITNLTPDDITGSDLNAYSLVYRLDFGMKSFLFTGDTIEPIEKEILADGMDVDCDVIKIAHHGGSDSSCSAFLDAASPDIAVISAGKDNEYGHPHQAVLDRLAIRGIEKVYRTDQSGTITVVTDGQKIEVSLQKAG